MLTKAEESDAPPAYSSSSMAAPAGAAVPEVARCNFVSISRTHNRIDGTYIVDPFMRVPTELLAPEEGGARPNLRLASAHGAIDADVWVFPVPDGDVKSESKTRLCFENKHGKTEVRLHTLGDLPCLVDAHSTHGAVHLTLPHDFVGVITTSTKHGKVDLPRELLSLGEANGVAKYFKGSQLGPGTWEGSQIDIKTTHGKIIWKAGLTSFGSDADFSTEQSIEHVPRDESTAQHSSRG